MENKHTYTAIDIERYHQGLLTPAERHALEKAALEDPFLADALDGYAITGVNIPADLAELKTRLQERTQSAKVIPIAGGSRSFPLLRVAAIVLLLAGAALLTYQFAFNKGHQEIAQAPVHTDSNSTAPVTPQFSAPVHDSPAANPNFKAPSAQEEKGKTAVTSPATGTISDNGIPENKGRTDNLVTTADKTDKESAGRQASPATGEIAAAKEEKPAATAGVTPVMADTMSASAMGNANAIASRKAPASAGYYNSKSRKSDDQSTYRNLVTNTFRGRVTDEHNVGVPFANVTNTIDNVGTYTDANGNFNLTYPDTVLNVQVHSIGYENKTVQLKNVTASTKVVMQEDRNSLSEVVLGTRKINTAQRKSDLNKKLEEPEPADGWDNYDAYLANNLIMPEEIEYKPSSTPTVEVSFEVDKYGEPTNFRIEKSLCPKCDVEAIRLIKEGPKWKRKARKNGRTTVTISF